MDAQLPERGGGGDERRARRRRKVKIAADKKEEVNIKERRKNRDKRCEIE